MTTKRAPRQPKPTKTQPAGTLADVDRTVAEPLAPLIDNEPAAPLAPGELVKPPAGHVAGFARPDTKGFTEAPTMSASPPPGQVAGYARPGIDGFSY